MRQHDRRAATTVEVREVEDAVVRREAAQDRECGTGPGVDRDAAIRLRAYQEWEAAGHPIGDGVEFWLTAEKAVGPREGEWDAPS
jgi:hypothetical protein